MADPEVRARVEQSTRVMDLVAVVKGVAARRLTDEDARDAVEKQLPDDVATVKGAIEHTAALRTDF